MSRAVAGSIHALFARLRAEGPAFWAEFSPGVNVVGSLRALEISEVGAWRAAVRGQRAGPAVPWLAGTVGWFGYEAGSWFERMPEPAAPRLLPDAWWGQIERAAAFDDEGRLLQSTGFSPQELASLVAPPAPTRAPVTLEEPAGAVFLAGVQRVLEHLRAGDCYQVNLSRRIVVRGRVDPLGVWLRLRTTNRSRRGVLLDLGDQAVISNSPELLLRVRGRRVLSVPIKGTAPLGEDRARLLASEKEQAELTMIVDLVRSDLGRVATPGSIATGPRRVGRVGHVWHAMQRVEAELAPGLDAVDAFGALFPAGSVTGAPKVRAMEVIRALEPVPRGVYCGSVGWFGPGGADVNVAIRTLSVRGEEAHVQTGSGLVLGSDPARELDEARLKAVRLLEAL